MYLYWGDVHNHCGISYGYGTLENALVAAGEQLDFCAVTGHAMWPDIPPRGPDTDYLVDFHERGFSRLAASWDDVRRTVAAANRPGHLVTFQSYEIHSRAHGDHHILSPDDDLPLVEAASPRELVERLSGHQVIAVPHHIAYAPGYRGINWETFSPDMSPVVEVYSKHGSGFSQDGPYPYLHTMGPRDGRNTALYGLRQGLHFGFTASTDHHAGYPGSYGDGRVAVWAEDFTRDAIWRALLARRCYAVTGDKIACRFSVGGSPMGSVVERPGPHEITLNVRGCDALDQVIVYRNGRPWKVATARPRLPAPHCERWKVRVEMGWGYSTELFTWDGEARVTDGEITSVEPCFRGQSVLAPSPERSDDARISALENRVLHQDVNEVAWRCQTAKNPSTLHPATAALILEIAGDSGTTLHVALNGVTAVATLGELVEAGRAAHLKEHASEAFLVHRAVSEHEYTLIARWQTEATDRGATSYCAEVNQLNGQCAWISPVCLA